MKCDPSMGVGPKPWMRWLIVRRARRAPARLTVPLKAGTAGPARRRRSGGRAGARWTLSDPHGATARAARHRDATVWPARKPTRCPAPRSRSGPRGVCRERPRLSGSPLARDW